MPIPGTFTAEVLKLIKNALSRAESYCSPDDREGIKSKCAQALAKIGEFRRARIIARNISGLKDRSNVFACIGANSREIEDFERAREAASCIECELYFKLAFANIARNYARANMLERAGRVRELVWSDSWRNTVSEWVVDELLRMNNPKSAREFAYGTWNEEIERKLLFRVAQSFIQQKDVQSARSILQSIVDRKDRCVLYAGLASLTAAESDFAASWSEYQEAPHNESWGEGMLVALAEAYARVGQLPKAREICLLIKHSTCYRSEVLAFIAATSREQSDATAARTALESNRRDLHEWRGRMASIFAKFRDVRRAEEFLCLGYSHTAHDRAVVSKTLSEIGAIEEARAIAPGDAYLDIKATAYADIAAFSRDPRDIQEVSRTLEKISKPGKLLAECALRATNPQIREW